MSQTDADRPMPPPTVILTPRIASDQIMKGRREVIIQHGAEEYRLRLTASGKLILTK